jgi:hypothetical protein
MTDNAEESAERYALLALQHDEDSPIALSLLGSIRLSQARPKDAVRFLQESLSKWLGKPSPPPLSYPERINLVKLLLEVEFYGTALEVLETLQLEDEENVELWYLYSCAYYHNPEESKEENWKNARECAEICLRLYERMEWEDEDLRRSCQEMLNETRKSGISVDQDDGDERSDADENEWEDSDDDVEMEGAT